MRLKDECSIRLHAYINLLNQLFWNQILTKPLQSSTLSQYFPVQPYTHTIATLASPQPRGSQENRTRSKPRISSRASSARARKKIARERYLHAIKTHLSGRITRASSGERGRARWNGEFNGALWSRWFFPRAPAGDKAMKNTVPGNEQRRLSRVLDLHKRGWNKNFYAMVRRLFLRVFFFFIRYRKLVFCKFHGALFIRGHVAGCNSKSYVSGVFPHSCGGNRTFATRAFDEWDIKVNEISIWYTERQWYWLI